VIAINEKPEYTKYVHIDEEVVFVEQREIFFEDVKSFSHPDETLLQEVLDHKLKPRTIEMTDITLAARFLNTYLFPITSLQTNES